MNDGLKIIEEFEMSDGEPGWTHDSLLGDLSLRDLEKLVLHLRSHLSTLTLAVLFWHFQP
jgi:hypothetical protein